MPSMESTSKIAKLKTRDRAYYRQRQKNRVFTALVQFFAEEAERRTISKRDLAEALSKDPAQITRWLSAPSNFELDTLSDILLALGAEMDHSIVRFDDRARQNYAHPAVTCGPSSPAAAGGGQSTPKTLQIDTTTVAANTSITSVDP